MEARPLPPPEIPETLHQLTPAWVGAALAAGGHGVGARVVAVRSEILGVGEGFVGQVARLHLTWSPAEGAGPATLIAKLPTAIRLNRALGEMLGAYEREIRFYRELASAFPLRSPRCFYSAMDPNPVEGREAEALRFAQRIPVWLLRILVPIFLWVGARTKRRYVLLLEDLRDATVGDQAAGCDEHQARRILRTLATTQAALWNATLLEARPWLADFAALPQINQIVFRRNRRAFFTEYHDRIDARVPPIVDWLGRHGVAAMRRLGARPHAPIHGDLRLDNLFFTTDGSELIVIDWQSVGFGRGVYDVAYFLTGNVAAPLLVEHEDALLHGYHDTLVEQGVDDYPYDRCHRDYQLAKTLLLHRLVGGAGLIDLTHERGQQILDRTFEGILATLPEGDLDALLRD